MNQKSNFFYIAIVFFNLVSYQNVAQDNTASNVPEIWYMGMNDSDKPKLFMKSIGKGEPVLVLHGGFGAEHSYLIDLVAPLSSKYHFVLFDQRGSLRSPVVDSLLTFQNNIEDIEWIRKELNIERLNIIGHSMGTRLAMAYADAYPNRVENLVLISPVDPALRIPEGVTDKSQLPPPKFVLATKYLQTRPEVKNTLLDNNIFIENKKDVKDFNYKKRLDYWRINFASVNIFNLSEWRKVIGGMNLFNSKAMRLIGGTAPEPYDYIQSLKKSGATISVVAGEYDFGNFSAMTYKQLYKEIVKPDGTQPIPENIFLTWKDYKDELPNLKIFTIKVAGHNPWIDRPKETLKYLEIALKRVDL